jgi:hypothetical protein
VPCLDVLQRYEDSRSNFFITAVVLGNAFAAEARLTKEAVSAIGAIILGDKSTAKYNGGFAIANPQFDVEERVWRFQVTDKFFATFPGSSIHFFEIRDKDAYYRIGSISGIGYDPKSAERFRMSPA